MKINLRFLYLLPLLGIFGTLRSFSEFVLEDETDPAMGKYVLLLLACSCAITALCYRSMAPAIRKWVLVTVAAIGALALESYSGWGSWTVYPHVFGKLFVIIHIFAIYGFHRRYGLPPLHLLMPFLLLGIIANLAIYHPYALSLSGFLDTERGVNVEAAMVLLLPALYYINQYLARGGMMRLLAFFLCMVLIVFLQHRTVWVAAGVALTLNGLLLLFGRVQGARLSSSRLTPLFLIPVFVLVSGGAVALSDQQVQSKLARSIDDIMHPSKGGTGNWRLQQLQAYQHYIEAYPIAGMRLDGFELPIQFYHLANDGGSQERVWKGMTGHHFHSFYVDRLFYFGGLGLLLTILVPVVLLARRLLQPVPLPPPTAALTVFSLSILVYSVSYDWPLYFFGVLGLALAAIAAAPALAAIAVPRAAPAKPRRRPMPALMPYPTPSHANASSSSSGA